MLIPTGHDADADPPPMQAGGRAAGLVGRMGRLTLKELRETLRDRRTVATLLLMPLLVYPLLSLAFQKLLYNQLRSAGKAVYRLGVETEDQRGVLMYYLARGHHVVEQQELRAAESAPASGGTPTSAAVESLGLPSELFSESLEIEIVDDVLSRTAEQRVDLGARVTWSGPAHPVLGVPVDVQCELLLVELSAQSRAAFAFVERRLQAAEVDLLHSRLARREAPSRPFVSPRRVAVAAAESAAPFSLGALVPLILILMTITGAVYPAIDLTAGERERGTLEALIAAPVPRMGLLLAKYVAVVAVALLTAGVNLAAMTVTIVTAGLGERLFGPAGLTGGMVLGVFGLLMLFTAFFSAVLLVLTSFARSFKEAQAYLIPLMLVSLAPGILSLVPGVTLNGLLAVTPLANIVLLARDVFEGSVDPLLAAVVIVSTVIYATAAIALAARVFGTDAILYGSEGSWSDVFRRPAEPRDAATPATALLCLAVLFPMTVLVASGLGRLEGRPVAVRLTMSSLATGALFAGVPVVVALLRRVRLRPAFRVRSGPARGYVAAVLLGLSLWPLAYELVLSLNALAAQAGFDLVDRPLAELARGLVDELRRISPAAVVLCLAVVPAVVEELFFRGFLFSALQQRLTAWQTIVVTSVLFGVFHVVVRDHLALERLAPSTLLGLVLGWICHRTGSVFPGLVLHAVNNAVLLLIACYQPGLEQIEWLNVGGWMQAEAGRGHLPAVLIGASLGLVTAAMLLMALGHGRATSRRSNANG